MTLADEKALLALQLLIEGNSLRSTERITGVDINTLMKLLVRAGEKCEKLIGRLIVNTARDVQCDEIWAFVQKKEGHKAPHEAHNDGMGDAYCFVAIERHTKLVLNFALGRRTQAATDTFIEGLRHATAPQRFLISTDGFQPYKSAITTTLSDRCDFAQVIKVYAGPRRPAQVQPCRYFAHGEGPSHGETRSREDLYEPRRTPESHDPPANVPPHAVDERFLEEVGKPMGCILHWMQGSWVVISTNPMSPRVKFEKA